MTVESSAKYSANTHNINAPAFLTAMIEYFEKQYEINLHQVFALGLSNRGQFVYRWHMKCQRDLPVLSPTLRVPITLAV
jgi:poly(3-hydroxybutyrate) depolymerase